MLDRAGTQRVRPSYEGFESPESFESPQAVAAYREQLLVRSRDEAAFIARQAPRRPFTLLEACSGNGRGLHALGLQGLLERGEGWEIAASRVAFAQAWARDLRLDHRVRHLHADCLEPPPGPNDHDVVAMVTGALGYFGAFTPDATERALRALHARARPQGRLVLELYQHPREVALCRANASGEARPWRELPPEDPWRFYLSHFRWDAGASILHHQKVFIHRSSGRVDDQRMEALRVWSLHDLQTVLGRVGFVPELACEDWNGAPYREGASERMIVVARRA